MVKPKKYRVGTIIGCAVLVFGVLSAIASIADIVIDAFRGMAPADPLARWVHSTIGLFINMIAVAAALSLPPAVVTFAIRAFRSRGK